MSRAVRAAGAALGAYGVFLALGRVRGSTREERRATLPGDALVPDPHLVTDHAGTIEATPGEIWPWLTQMGWHRGGFYTPSWVDRLLFPANRPSLDRLDPDLVRDLAVGDTIPDGPPGTAEYVVARVEAPHTLVLHSTTHLPPGWEQRYGAAIDWTWTFRLHEVAPGRTRMHVRVRGRVSPWWLRVLFVAALTPADLVMAPGMLRGLRRRVEAGPRPAA